MAVPRKSERRPNSCELGNVRRPEEHRWRLAETTSQIAALPATFKCKIIGGRLSAVDIANWLRGLGRGKYAPAFDENAINWDVLSELTTDDLKDMGSLRSAIGDGCWRRLPLSARVRCRWSRHQPRLVPSPLQPGERRSGAS
jgi:SAM domain (Sterile alpha motif)